MSEVEAKRQQFEAVMVDALNRLNHSADEAVERRGEGRHMQTGLAIRSALTAAIEASAAWSALDALRGIEP